MKHLTVMLLAAGIMMLAACKEKKSADGGIITTDYEPPKPEAPIAMPATKDSKVVEWVDGRVYKVTVARTPADSLTMVINAVGQKFIDNAVKLTILRSDSTVFYNHTFTKAAFAQYMNKDYMKNALLNDIRYLECSGTDMDFVVVFNYPDAIDDESLDLKLTINSHGNINIEPFGENAREDLFLTEN